MKKLWSLKRKGDHMRRFYLLSALLTLIVVLYRWRYRIVNFLLAINFFKKMTVSIAMRIPFFSNLLFKEKRA